MSLSSICKLWHSQLKGITNAGAIDWNHGTTRLSNECIRVGKTQLVIVHSCSTKNALLGMCRRLVHTTAHFWVQVVVKQHLKQALTTDHYSERGHGLSMEKYLQDIQTIVHYYE